MIELLIEYDDYEHAPYVKIEYFDTEEELKSRLAELEADMKEKYSEIQNYKVLS